MIISPVLQSSSHHRDQLTVSIHSKTPPQSPVLHAFPPPFFPFKLLAPVPIALKLQFVLPHTRPCQSAATLNSLFSPGCSSNPPVPGPVPDCVPIPGQIVSAQLFTTVICVPPSRFRGGPHWAGRDREPLLSWRLWIGRDEGVKAEVGRRLRMMSAAVSFQDGSMEGWRVDMLVVAVLFHSSICILLGAYRGLL